MKMKIIQDLRKLVKAATEKRPTKYNRNGWCGSGYIGIDWIPVRAKEWGQILDLLDKIDSK